MGCSASREIVLDSENKVVVAEFGLGIAKQSSSKIKKVIYRYSTKGLISVEQLKRVYQHLEIEKSEVLKKYIETYYRLESHYYDSIKLTVLGVLLGSDSIKSKCKMLFEIYSSNLSDSIECDGLKSMINTIIDISFIIGINYTIELNKLDEKVVSELKIYKKSLKKVRPEVLDYFINEVMKGSQRISFSEMLIAFSSSNINTLLNSHILRVHSMMINKIFSENETQKKTPSEVFSAEKIKRKYTIDSIIHSKNSLDFVTQGNNFSDSILYGNNSSDSIFNNSLDSIIHNKNSSSTELPEFTRRGSFG